MNESESQVEKSVFGSGAVTLIRKKGTEILMADGCSRGNRIPGFSSLLFFTRRRINLSLFLRASVRNPGRANKPLHQIGWHG